MERIPLLYKKQIGPNDKRPLSLKEKRKTRVKHFHPESQRKPVVCHISNSAFSFSKQACVTEDRLINGDKNYKLTQKQCISSELTRISFFYSDTNANPLDPFKILYSFLIRDSLIQITFSNKSLELIMNFNCYLLILTFTRTYYTQSINWTSVINH